MTRPKNRASWLLPPTGPPEEMTLRPREAHSRQLSLLSVPSCALACPHPQAPSIPTAYETYSSLEGPGKVSDCPGALPANQVGTRWVLGGGGRLGPALVLRSAPSWVPRGA